MFNLVEVAGGGGGWGVWVVCVKLLGMAIALSFAALGDASKAVLRNAELFPRSY